MMNKLEDILQRGGLGPIVVACGAAPITRAMIRTGLDDLPKQSIEVCADASQVPAQMPADAVLILDGDDAACRRAMADCNARTIWVGRGADCDVTATNVQSSWGHLRFHVDGQDFDVPVWGRHHLAAALAAIAVGRLSGREITDLAKSLTTFRSLPGYCDVFPAAGATLIDDTCNTSHAALELLREFPSHSRRIVVCSDDDVSDAPRSTCCQKGEEVVVRCGADLLVACGPHASEIRSGAMHAGMPRAHATAYRTPDEAVEHLRRTIRAGDTVLFQGSHARGMKSIVESLRTPLRREAA